MNADEPQWARSAERKLNWSMIGVIVALLVQTVAVVFWSGSLDQRVSALEQTTAPLADGTLARLDERTLAMQESLRRIEEREETR